MAAMNTTNGVMDDNIRHIHMLGVNGISMSGLAEILLDRGYRVSGSDLNFSDRTEKLSRLGACIMTGNTAQNLEAAGVPDLLVYTAAAGPGNPERARAAELGVKSVDRAELLGMIMAGHDLSIGVSGTHGKTTTSFMIASILLADGLDPTINIGGEYAPIGGNTRIGGKALFLAEACEYVDSFLKLRPSIAVITNIEYDHTDYFRDVAHLRASFAQFASQAGKAVVANADDENVALVEGLRRRAENMPEGAESRIYGIGGAESRIYGIGGAESQICGSGGAGSHICGSGGAGSHICGSGGTGSHICGSGGAESRIYGIGGADNPHWITFGVKNIKADYIATDIEYAEDYDASFTLFAKPRGESVRIRLRAPGVHNVYNALAAATAAMAAGCSTRSVVMGLEEFAGVKKRFEYKGNVAGCDIYDDYAHHPSAVALTLKAARARAGGGRVICVFQPHTYSRTRTFLHEFASAFLAADIVMLADIFPAREKDPGDISSAMLADAINSIGGRARYYAGGFPEIARAVAETARKGDVALTMGAGLASSVADILLS